MALRKIPDVGKKFTIYVVKIQCKTLTKNFIHVKKCISRKCDTKYLEKIVYLGNKFLR